MKKKILFILSLFSWGIMTAQHDHEMKMEHDSMDHMKMNHSFSLNLPMSRDGSGTGWRPDTTPMYGHGTMIRDWMIMFHSNIFIRYNKQDVFDKGTRGGEKIDAPNWFMLMAQRKTGKHGLFHSSLMFSLDPLTVGSEGYPRLFQTGETYQGKPLIDKQHPHDLLSGLSVAYTHELNKQTDVTLYIAYPGEPALGPVAFMHRLSALNNPDAPLGHHWQDATHITFGVATLGIRYGIFKIEGSSFTGREPNENRYDLDKPRFDSYSGRLSCNPTKQIALQFSSAFIHSPELLEPEMNINRTTASVIYQLPLGSIDHYLTAALVWGLNDHGHQQSNSILVEPSLQLGKTVLYGRFEWVQKSSKDLGVEQEGLEKMFNINEYTFGLNRMFFSKAGTNLALGAQGSLYLADPALDIIYGKFPIGAEVYLRIYPGAIHMHQMDHKH